MPDEISGTQFYVPGENARKEKIREELQKKWKIFLKGCWKLDDGRLIFEAFRRTYMCRKFSQKK